MSAVPVSTAPHLRRITLVKQHIHAGIPHRAGDVIELDRDLADWLIAEGAASAEPSLDAAEASESSNPKHPTHKEK